MSEAIEITTFHLVSNKMLSDFIAANADVDAWLLQQKGFKSRRIAQGADGVVVDMLIWTTADAAHRAATKLMRELRDSPVHAVIDQGTVSWQVSTVGHTFGVVGPSNP
jgi:hypothetical protein